MKGPRRYFFALGVVVVAAGIIALLGVNLLAGNAAPFDAGYLAITERKMWQAYYGKDKTTLGLLLIQSLRRQYGISILEAGETGTLLASAAMKFSTAKPGHYNEALPDLVKAYTQILMVEQKHQFHLEYWLRHYQEHLIDEIEEFLSGLPPHLTNEWPTPTSGN